MTTDNLCLTREETRAALRIGASSLKVLIARKELREIRVGRRSLIPRAELERYITERLATEK